MDIRKTSDRQERRTAKEFGGRIRPGSGNKDGAKGDAITGVSIAGQFNPTDFLIENKFTRESYYSLKLDTWNKIANEALRENMRTPLMQLDIAVGSPVCIKLVVIDLNDFVGLGLEEYYPIVHSEVVVTSKSFRIHALEFHMHSYKTAGYNKHYSIRTGDRRKDRNLIVLNLEEFKEAIAICR